LIKATTMSPVMDVDKILPSISTLGWHKLQVKDEVQTTFSLSS